jgi:predicted dinucleotide-binding enzyme
MPAIEGEAICIAVPGARRPRVAVRKVGKTVKPIAEKKVPNDAAELAIAQVLGAERDARDSVASAQLEVQHIAENARAQARSVAERTERRIRSVVGAFEQELATRLAQLEAEGAQFDVAQPLGADEQAALRRAVEALARELIGAPR